MMRADGPAAPVFMSHSSTDHPQALALKSELAAAGVECWVAPEDIQPSQEWASAIADAINAAAGLIVLVSRASNRSRQVAREVAMATERGIPLAVVRLAEVNLTGTMQYLLQLTQWIDAFPSFDGRMAEIAAAVVRGLTRAPARDVALTASLETQPNIFVGRETEREAVGVALTSHRLVTIRGPGGIGKTRLARRVASDMRHRFPDGIVIAELATISDPRAVPGAIALAAGLEPGADSSETLRRELSSADALIVLDNVEQISGIEPVVAQLLASLTRIRVLVTSTRSLNIRGQFVLPLSTLGPTVVDGDPGDAIRLFIARAQEAGADASLLADVDAIRRICELVDGLPLGIELAAARARYLHVSEIYRQLNEPSSLVNTDSDAPARHRTLDAAIGWSFDLLSRDAQATLHRACVFRGSFDLSSLRAVCGWSTNDLSKIDHLAELVDNSLVTVTASDSGVRYRTLDTIRRFAASGVNVEVRRDSEMAHFGYFQDLTARAFPELIGPAHREWMQRLRDDADNIREAMARGPDLGLTGAAVAMASQFRRYLIARGQLQDAQRILTELIKRAETDEVALPTLAEALNSLGATQLLRNELGEARATLEKAVALWRDVGDRAGEARAISNLAAAHRHQGGADRMQQLLREAIALSEDVGDAWGAAASMGNLAIAYGMVGDFTAAREQYRLVQAKFAALGDRSSVAMATLGIGGTLLRQGMLAQAEVEIERARRLYTDLGDIDGIASTDLWRGQLLTRQGRFEDARQVLASAAREAATRDDGYSLAEAADRLAEAVEAAGDVAEAAVLLGFAHGKRDRNGWEVETADVPWLDALTTRLRDRLGEVPFRAHFEEGVDLGDRGQTAGVPSSEAAASMKALLAG